MLVSCSNLRVEYRSGGERLLALDIPEWSLEEGRLMVLSGPSGSGKSTLLHVLAGLLPPTGGEAVVDGVALHALGEAARDRFRAERLSCIHQSFNLLQGYSVLENVRLGAAFAGRGPARGGKGEVRTGERLAEELLDRVGLGDRLRSRPSQLSIGEQQRVAIARAFVKKPRLVLADEPTGSLDPANRRLATDLLRDFCLECRAALLIVTHDEEVAARFDARSHFPDINRAFKSADSLERSDGA